MRLARRIAALEAQAAELSCGGGGPILYLETWDGETYTTPDGEKTYTRAELDEYLAQAKPADADETWYGAEIVDLSAWASGPEDLQGPQ